jgi:hypothetical protein
VRSSAARHSFLGSKCLIDQSRYLGASFNQSYNDPPKLCHVEHSASYTSAPPPASTVRRRFCFYSALLLGHNEGL